MFDWNVWISLVNAQRLIGGTCSVTLSLLASRLSRITELRQSRWKCLGEGVRVKRGDSQSLLKIIYIFPFSCSIRIEQTLIRVDLEMRSNTIVISIFRTSDELPYGERQFAVSAACSVSLNHPTTSQRNWIEFKIWVPNRFKHPLSLSESSGSLVGQALAEREQIFELLLNSKSNESHIVRSTLLSSENLFLSF